MAANDLNLCQFIGNLGADPEKRAMPNGKSVTKIRIACNWKSGDREGVEWVTVIAFDKLADVMAQYLRKGSKVYIGGHMRTRKWQDQGGQDRYSTEIVARDLQMLDGRPEGTHQPAGGYEAGQSSAPAGDDFSDDIPF